MFFSDKNILHILNLPLQNIINLTFAFETFYSDAYKTVNTKNMSGMFIMLQPIIGEIFMPQKSQPTVS